jgi:hypothetical protein
MININQDRNNQKSEKSLIRPIDKSLASKVAIPKLNL